MPDQEYLTVGQLARKVGTTVRTIQYYDQQGLLSPSAKSPGGQRLYSPEDETALYRILTLKYLGLSLADIKEQQSSMESVGEFREVLSGTMEALEDDFQSLVKRLSVLRALFKQAAEVEGIDWPAFAHTIEAEQAEGALFWHRMDEEPAEQPEMSDSYKQKRGMAIAKWHELIADAIALMNSQVAPTDPRAAELAQRYNQLKAESEGSLSQTFEIAANVSSHHGAAGSFDALRDSVMAYLSAVLAARGNEQA